VRLQIVLYLEAAEDTLRRRGKGLSVFLGGTENRKTHEMVTHADLVGLVLAHGHLHGAGVAAAASDDVRIQWGEESTEVIFPWAHGTEERRRVSTSDLFWDVFRIII